MRARVGEAHAGERNPVGPRSIARRDGAKPTRHVDVRWPHERAHLLGGRDGQVDLGARAATVGLASERRLQQAQPGVDRHREHRPECARSLVPQEPSGKGIERRAQRLGRGPERWKLRAHRGQLARSDLDVVLCGALGPRRGPRGRGARSSPREHALARHRAEEEQHVEHALLLFVEHVGAEHELAQGMPCFASTIELGEARVNASLGVRAMHVERVGDEERWPPLQGEPCCVDEPPRAHFTPGTSGLVERSSLWSG